MANHGFVSKFCHFTYNFEKSIGRVNYLFRGYQAVRNHSNLSRIFENQCLHRIKVYPCSSYRWQNKNLHFTQSCHCSSDASVSNASKDEYGCSFQTSMLQRRSQAERSVLVELLGKEDVLPASALCQNFGKIEKLFSYSGESNNVFLLVEFCDEASTNNLLAHCQFSNITDAFPIPSRLVRFERKQEYSLPEVHMDVMEDILPSSFRSNPKNVSELIQDLYQTEKLTELNIRLRYFFCAVLKDAICGLFSHCEVLPFGSSVNGVGKQGCDLDVMIRLYPQQVSSKSDLFFLTRTCVGDVQALQRKAIIRFGDLFHTFLPGISSVQKIVYARVPILKLKHRILKMDCDVSINNVSAILMSELIYFCGEIDDRVRPLIYAVKRWARETNITYDSPGTWITNFGLSLLVLFFLQNQPSPVLPPLNDAIEILGTEGESQFKIVYSKSVSELQKEASSNKDSLAVLLKDFLSFLGTYPFGEQQISLLMGTALPRNETSPIYVQYPLEEGLNVTKNVSEYELWDLRQKASASAKYLALNMNQRVSQTRDLSILLGVPHLKKLDLRKGRKLDVGSLLADDHLKTKRKKRAI